jgi:hypothetical protein
VHRPNGFSIPPAQNFVLFAVVAYFVYATTLHGAAGNAFVTYILVAMFANIGLALYDV